jgi:Cu/Ag efflux protein CusF
MRQTILAVVVALFALSVALHAQPATIDGQVTKVDAAAGKLTIRHGPLKQFDMDEPMTMVYGVQDPAVLKSVKAGDKIKFQVDRIDGKFTVTGIQKAK